MDEAVEICCLRGIGPGTHNCRIIPLRDGNEVTIGRATDVSVVILSGMISRKHAILNKDNGVWLITDNKSVNGILVNGKRLVPEIPSALHDGDTVQLAVATAPDKAPEFVWTFFNSLRVKKKHISSTISEPSNSKTVSVKRKRSVDDVSCLPVKVAISSQCSEDITSSVVEHQEAMEYERQLVIELEKQQAIEAERQLAAERERLFAFELEKQLVIEREKQAAIEEEKQHAIELERQIAIEREKQLSIEHEKQLALEREKQLAIEREKQLALDREKELALERERQLVIEREKQQAIEREHEIQLRQQEDRLAEMTVMLAERDELQRQLQEELEKKDSYLQEEMTRKQLELEEGKRHYVEELRELFENQVKEREQHLLDKLECEKQSLLDERNRIEAVLRQDMANQLGEKDRELEEQLLKERERLDKVLEAKEAERKQMESELSSERQRITQEKEHELNLARDNILSNLAEVMESELQCSICSELFVQATSLNCSHSFCALCIRQWMTIKSECPICRSPITSHLRSIVLDSYIDKMVDELNVEVRERRKALVEERAVLQKKEVEISTKKQEVTQAAREDDRTRLLIQAARQREDANRQREQAIVTGLRVEAARQSAHQRGHSYHRRASTERHITVRQPVHAAPAIQSTSHQVQAAAPVHRQSHQPTQTQQPIPTINQVAPPVATGVQRTFQHSVPVNAGVRNWSNHVYHNVHRVNFNGGGAPNVYIVGQPPNIQPRYQ